MDRMPVPLAVSRAASNRGRRRTGPLGQATSASSNTTVLTSEYPDERVPVVGWAGNLQRYPLAVLRVWMYEPWAWERVGGIKDGT